MDKGIPLTSGCFGQTWPNLAKTLSKPNRYRQTGRPYTVRTPAVRCVILATWYILAILYHTVQFDTKPWVIPHGPGQSGQLGPLRYLLYTVVHRWFIGKTVKNGQDWSTSLCFTHGYEQTDPVVHRLDTVGHWSIRTIRGKPVHVA